MDMVRDISDWVIVMAQGQIVAEGTPTDVMANPAVIDAYLGAHHDTDISEADEREIQEAALEELAEEAESD
jgi:branched-chain amino acid transport system ATP-binding protein